jgi:hypothetical protein
MGLAASIPGRRFVAFRAQLVRGLLALAVAGASGRALAQSASTPDPRTAQPERPTVATHAHTVAPGYVEIEAGVLGIHPQPGSSRLDVPGLVKIGLSTHVQLDVFVDWSRTTVGGGTTSGVGDTALGLKWRVLDRAPALGDFAVESIVKLATGSPERFTGTGTTDFSMILISSHSKGPLSLDVNVGYTYRTGSGLPVAKHVTLWTVSPAFNVYGRLGWTAEVFGYPGTRGLGGNAPQVGMTVGPTFVLHRTAVVDAGVVVNVRGLNANALYAGITWNVGRLPFLARGRHRAYFRPSIPFLRESVGGF